MVIATALNPMSSGHCVREPPLKSSVGPRSYDAMSMKLSPHLHIDTGNRPRVVINPLRDLDITSVFVHSRHLTASCRCFNFR
ncbi:MULTISPECIES: hypothetical protein [Rhizobium]|uniref:Uncharacterized protein n=1 Tax=Rhizobium rhododendri TaxID=2506430 RepID=A0ABY8IS10_9HYPH|nr:MULTISPECIES: hypothetical protein [Rhizobium]MBZ5763740.1 hypothetical protein [Rhizobium sp. VS19-DR96]MBZ5769673.1 hypothetical protein [Rhizobium sp. VS19-DR129.2]MBZ5777223.1 hypothetical protein [Rhizobium sp. VS19-DRK62.2]MBZ5788354.1 hypothetical protein [Rhizobium sp. VS19-DR121]MBZ5805801.1 hypothetical protein [Rhizobium sp. VS19-DR181]